MCNSVQSHAKKCRKTSTPLKLQKCDIEKKKTNLKSSQRNKRENVDVGRESSLLYKKAHEYGCSFIRCALLSRLDALSRYAFFLLACAT